MNFNFINANTTIFSACRSYISNTGLTTSATNPLYIKTEPLRKFAILSDFYSEVDHFKIKNYECFKFKLEEYTLFAISSDEEISIQANSLDFSTEPCPAELFTYIANKSKITPKGNATELANKLQLLNKHQKKDRIGIDLDSIRKFYPQITILKGRSEKLNACTAPQMLAIFLSSGKSDILPEHTARLINAKCQDFSLRKYPHEILSTAMTCAHHKHAFIEIYRSIEYLFPIPKLKALHTKLCNDKINISELSKIIEEDLNWRPIEESALKELLEEVNTTEPFKEIEAMTVGGTTVHNYIYKKRNSLIHFRAIFDQVFLKENEWHKLLHSLTEISFLLYEKHQQLLLEK